MNIGETIKSHPWGSVAVLAVGVLILFALLSGGGGSASASADGTTADSGMQSAELQAATQMATAQLAYKSNQDQLTSAENIASLTTNADLLAHYSDNDTALKVAGIQAGVQTKGIDAQSAMTIAGFKNQTDLAAITAGVNLASIAAQKDTTIAQTNALADANKLTAQLGAQTTMQANQLNAQTTALLSNNQASVQKTQSNNSLWGNVLGTVGSLLAFL